MTLQKEQTELGEQLLGYLEQHRDNWVKDFELYESFKTHSKETIHNQLSLLCEGNLIQRTQYRELKNPTKNHFQYFSYRIDQEGRNIISNSREESKTYALSLAGLMLAALALLVAFKLL